MPSHDGASCEIRGQQKVELDADGYQVGTRPPSLGDGVAGATGGPVGHTAEQGLAGGLRPLPGKP